jgi:hypothetical protein
MPPITFAELKDHPDTFLSMTGLSVDEFRQLVPMFGSIWTKTHAADGQEQGRRPAIRSMQDRLIFILFYYKCHPLQQILGYLFGVSQERACELIHEYTEIMLEMVRENGLAPERISEELKKSLSKIHKGITSSMQPSDPSSDPKTKTSRKNSTAGRVINTPSRTI